MANSAVVYLEIGDEGLPTEAPPNTIIIGPTASGALAKVDDAGVIVTLPDGNHNHDDEYYKKTEVDTKIQQVESSTNNSITVVNDRITTVEGTINSRITNVEADLNQKITTQGTTLNTSINLVRSDMTSAIGVVDSRLTNVNNDLLVEIDKKKDDFVENTGFNKQFGILAGTVAEGDHVHEHPYSIHEMNGVTVMCIEDTIRGYLVSVETGVHTFAESQVSKNEWMKIGRATDTDTGFIMPHNGVIVGYSAQCENGNGKGQNYRLYINGNETDLFQFSYDSGNVQSDSMNTNLTFLKGDKIRLRAGSGGTTYDTVVNLFVKWRP